MKFNTLLVHGGKPFDEKTGALSYPIYQATTYKQDGIGKHRGYEYSRTGNPTREALEKLICEMEGGVRGFAFSSGMAAISSVIMLFNYGDEILVTRNVYGGTFRVFDKVFKRFGIIAKFIDTTDLDVVENAINNNTKAIFIETPTNPLLDVTDIREVSRISKKYGIITIVDNTFMTPYFQRPLELGADIVIHSATKYLGGHSDVLAGLVVVNSDELAERMHFIQNSVGAVLGPQDSWLLMRGIKTLGLRMERHEKNAREIAEWLKELPEVRKVYYPGLQEHRGHEVMKKQCSGFGGMISFELHNRDEVEKFISRLRIIYLAESLGAVESLISVPSKMTHASIPEEERLKLGINDTLLRLSVGIEDVEDLKEDIFNALRR